MFRTHLRGGLRLLGTVSRSAPSAAATTAQCPSCFSFPSACVARPRPLHASPRVNGSETVLQIYSLTPTAQTRNDALLFSAEGKPN